MVWEPGDYLTAEEANDLAEKANRPLSAVVTEEIFGTKDSVNDRFNTAYSIIPGTLALFRNGLHQIEGNCYCEVDDDPRTFKTATPPNTNDILTVIYRTFDEVQVPGEVEVLPGADRGVPINGQRQIKKGTISLDRLSNETIDALTTSGPRGPQGEPGVSLDIEATVATYSDLPASPQMGQAFVVASDGLLYFYDGTSFPDEGNGVPFRGPEGPEGSDGQRGLPGDAGAPGLAGLSSGGGVTGWWKWVSVPGTPGALQMSIDTSDIGTATKLRFSKNDKQDINFGEFLLALATNSHVCVQSKLTPTAFATFTVRSKPVDNGTWVELSVLVNKLGGSPSATWSEATAFFQIL